MADSGGHATLACWIKGLRTMAAEMPGQFVENVAGLMQKELTEAAASNRGLDGEEWAPRVKDGERALANVMNHVGVYTHKNSVIVELQGGAVFSQFGTKRQVARRLLPAAGLPKKLGTAISLGFVEMSQAFMTRGGRHDRGATGAKWTPKATVKS